MGSAPIKRLTDFRNQSELRMKRISIVASLALLFSAFSLFQNTSAQEIVVPGTGIKITQVGDDFEDESWSYIFNGQKSSEEIDGQTRAPAGRSTNGRWYEGVKRGQPDVVKRVSTPEGGLPGSEGSLLIQSLHTGVPGRPSYKMQQEDFICDVHYRLKGAVQINQSPNCVVRVFLPPVDEWENRSGPHFAFRLALETTVSKPGKGFFSAGSSRESETYWPGMFIEFESKDGKKRLDDFAYIRVRSNSRGGDYKAKQITQTGWWTMGMSVTPNGKVHYFAKPGIEDLTMEDHIASEFPYGYRCEKFKTFFFNVCNGDDGKTWSTPWIIDDPTMYFLKQ